MKGIEEYHDHLQQFTALKAQYADAHNNLGLVLSHLGRHDEAFMCLNRALQLNPRYTDAALNRCFVMADAGHVADAFREMKKQYVRGPHDLSMVLTLGVFCMRHGWIENGLTQFLNAVSIKKTTPFILAYAAAAHLEAGDKPTSKSFVAQARNACLEAEIDPEECRFPDLDIYRNWDNPQKTMKLPLLVANFYAEQERFDEAGEAYMDVFRKYPGHVDALVGLGRVALARGNHEDAATWFMRAKTTDPDSHTAIINLGFFYAETGNIRKAVDNLEMAVMLRPLFPDYRYHLGCFYLSSNRLDEAIREFNRALTINPEYGLASLQLASAHMTKGNFAGAVSVLQESKCMNWPEANELMAKAHLEAGKRNEAVKFARKALELDPESEEAARIIKSLED